MRNPFLPIRRRRGYADGGGGRASSSSFRRRRHTTKKTRNPTTATRITRVLHGSTSRAEEGGFCGMASHVAERVFGPSIGTRTTLDVDVEFPVHPVNWY